MIFLFLIMGTKVDGTTDFLSAITKAIAACNERVIIPAGTYLVKGPIHFKRNVNLHLEKGAVVNFSTNPEDYLLVVSTWYEGMQLMNYSPLLYAYGKENIAVTGKGVFDSQASDEHWCPWAGKEEHGWEEG